LEVVLVCRQTCSLCSQRDEILGHKPNDIDYSVETESYESMRNHLLNNDFTICREKPEYGSIMAKCPISRVVSDYTLCRKDGYYSDFRRPDSITISNIDGDLSRRDFTMNAIAKIDNKYYDPFSGIDDIEKKLIRCVGLPVDRLTEDPLRGLRAIRFSVTKGFTIDNSIIEILKSNTFIENFKTLNKERIHAELSKMFKYDTIRSIKILNDLPDELLEVIFSNGLWLIPSLKKNKK
jgi:tRNA nucleotidyltransferase (CCA-adding enzyme)